MCLCLDTPESNNQVYSQIKLNRAKTFLIKRAGVGCLTHIQRHQYSTQSTCPGLFIFAKCLPPLSRPIFLSIHYPIKATTARRIIWKDKQTCTCVRDKAKDLHWKWFHSSVYILRADQDTIQSYQRDCALTKKNWINRNTQGNQVIPMKPHPSHIICRFSCLKILSNRET